MMSTTSAILQLLSYVSVHHWYTYFKAEKPCFGIPIYKEREFFIFFSLGRKKLAYRYENVLGKNEFSCRSGGQYFVHEIFFRL